MSGYVRISLIFGLGTLVACLTLSWVGFAWAAGCILPVASLAGGYIGGAQSKDDPSKTARNARSGAFTGIAIAALGIGGRLAASFIAPEAAGLNALQDGCLIPLALVVGLVLGGVGGWAYVRHEHERQTGYKPT